MRAFSVSNDLICEGIEVSLRPFPHIHVDHELGSVRVPLSRNLATSDSFIGRVYRASVARTGDGRYILVAERDPDDRRALVYVDVDDMAAGGSVATDDAAKVELDTRSIIEVDPRVACIGRDSFLDMDRTQRHRCQWALLIMEPGTGFRVIRHISGEDEAEGYQAFEWTGERLVGGTQEWFCLPDEAAAETL